MLRAIGGAGVLTEQHPNIDFVVADVASPDDATRTVTTVVDRWGRLDVLVNNAGAGAILPPSAGKRR
jgi:NAD(P)-dependent dehydrogenase (short-subunit alcohol dehydrogenase family)